MPRFDADWIDSMLQPARRGSPPAEQTLTQLALQPGQIVADVGCGPGFFTIAAARVVGSSGRVYAIDSEPAMLELVGSAAAAAGLTNVEIQRSVNGSIPLASAVADLTLCALVLHDLPDPATLVRELDRITRAGGRIAIVEWTPARPERRANRIAPERLADLLARVGRHAVDTLPISDQQYLVVAT